MTVFVIAVPHASAQFRDLYNKAKKKAQEQINKSTAETSNPSTSTPSVSSDEYYSHCQVALTKDHPSRPLTVVFSDIFTFNPRMTKSDPSQGTAEQIAWHKHIEETYGTVGLNLNNATCSATQVGTSRSAERVQEEKKRGIESVKLPWKVLEDHWTMYGKEALASLPVNALVPESAPVPTASTNRRNQRAPVTHSYYCTSDTLGKDHLYFSASFIATEDKGKEFAAFLKSKYNVAEGPNGTPCYGNHSTIEQSDAQMQNQLNTSNHAPAVMTGWKP